MARRKKSDLPRCSGIGMDLGKDLGWIFDISLPVLWSGIDFFYFFAEKEKIFARLHGQTLNFWATLSPMAAP